MTQAMTAQEALALLERCARPKDDAYGPNYAISRAANALKHALSDAERRAMEAVRGQFRMQNAAIDLSVRLSAVEARCAKMREDMVERFLAWPLPETVCSDLCVTKADPQSVKHRIGTNLLTANEARQMIEYLFAPSILAYPGGKSEEPVIVERDALQAMWHALDEACPHVASALRAAHPSVRITNSTRNEK